MDRKDSRRIAIKKIIRSLIKVFSGMLSFVTVMIVFLAVAIYYLAQWVIDTWGLLSMDEIIFHLKVPLEGTNEDMVIEAVNLCIPVAIFTVLAVIVLLIGIKKRGIRNITKLILCGVSIYLVFFSVQFVYDRLDVEGYLKSQKTNSTFIQDNYVDPRAVQISFPESKRNLIYIYLESMESTYASMSEGGGFEYNCIPELTQLANDNINFSNSEGLGGAHAATGATWTMGAMFAQSTGLPLKTQDELTLRDEYLEEDEVVFPSVVAIGDILQQQGYQQVLMIGSDKRFAGRGNFYTQHGNYDIIDWIKAGEMGLIPPDYREFWGFEDQKLFEFSKNKILELAEAGIPFNFTMLTVDTHFEDGYVCPLCQDIYGNQYANVMACSSRQVADFVSWIQQQPFYANTTIVITGDHLTMDRDFCLDLDKNYDRTVYNAFINSAVGTENMKNRQFTTMDLFPTTLASMGVAIDGNRLGLGTNLFSGEATVTEKYGLEKENKELGRKSEFYNQLLQGTEALSNKETAE